MALELGKIGRPMRPDRQPLFERVQEFIFRMDVGSGGFFRIGMFFLLVMFIILLYTGTQFFGLRDPAAMDAGQLGRNLWRGDGYVTKNLRPVDLWYLHQFGSRPLAAGHTAVSELWTPPGYPLVLALVFKVVRPSFEVAAGFRALKADRLLMVVSWLWFLGGLALLYAVAYEMFDQHVAMLAGFLYLFCDPILDFAISGLSMNFLMVVFLLVFYALYKAEKWELAGKSGWWSNGALAVAALALGLGTLTAYPFASLLLPLLVYVAVSFPRWRYARLALCLALFGLVLLPWVARNWRVSHTLFGLVRYELVEDTGGAMGGGVASIYEVKPTQLRRTYGLDVSLLKPWFYVRKALLSLRQLYEVGLKEIGANYLLAFFLVGLLHRWRSLAVFRLRRFVFWGLIVCLVWLGAAGPPTRNFLNLFLPVVIIYAAAFFYVLFERLQYKTRLLRYGMLTLFVALNSLSFIYTILPPTTTRPYPPYDGGICMALGKVFTEDEVLCSDIPWAVAWYGDRAAVWAPYEEKDYMAINDGLRFISGIYLTQATFQGITTMQLLAGEQRFWVRMFQPPPPNFPLQTIQGVTPDGQQVLISTHAR